VWRLGESRASFPLTADGKDSDVIVSLSTSFISDSPDLHNILTTAYSLSTLSLSLHSQHDNVCRRSKAEQLNSNGIKIQ
jgi:hypothetical protein